MKGLVVLALAACGPKKPVTDVHDHGSATPDAGVVTADAATEAKPDDKPDPKKQLLVAELDAYAAAKPVFDKHCARCHTLTGKSSGKKKLEHFEMDGYPLGGHHAKTIGVTIRNVIGLGGARPTMPQDKPGAVKGDELALIKAWCDAWVTADQGGAH